LIAVAAGHAAMALIHHFHNRDGVLKRMLPFTRS
jgi:cytochrome b561